MDKVSTNRQSHHGNIYCYCYHNKMLILHYSIIIQMLNIICLVGKETVKDVVGTYVDDTNVGQ